MEINFLTRRVFRFERTRLGSNTISPHGEKYGPYLYRNIITRELIASWDEPKASLNKGEDIGYNTDALKYYKNC